jgi:hypothetical protein
MSNEPETMTINKVEYVRKDSVKQTPEVLDDYVIIRSRDSGVHAGYLKSRDGSEVVLTNARRIWKWSGAATLSELAMKGAAKPSGCHVPAAVTEITVLGVCEIIPCTDEARKNIEGLKAWTMH